MEEVITISSLIGQCWACSHYWGFGSADNHIAVLYNNDQVAFVLVLGVDGGLGLGVGVLLLHDDLRRPMLGEVVGLDKPLVLETMAT